MIPFKLTAAARAANMSPSINAEKGAYRIRAPSVTKSTPFTSRRGPPRARNPDRFSTYMTLLVVLLATACLTSFGVAYYLFTTRWEAKTLHHVYDLPADQDTQAVRFKIDTDQPALRHRDVNEKFLSYLPHSGFHNQRIAFENALVLSRILNRTLLVPPIRLGNKPIRYVKFDTLQQFLALSGKEGTYHCANIPLHVPSPPECLDYFDYTHIPWDWLVDLTEVRSHQRLLQRWNMTREWTYDQLHITDADTLFLRDVNPYHFRFLDTARSSQPVGKYTESLDIPTLALSQKRLLQIGTLFGSSRLRLRNSSNVAIRSEIRQSMTFTNSDLVDAADTIVAALGGSYLGAHVRLGDGQFVENGATNVRLIWWKLVQDVLGYTAGETLDLERALRGPGLHGTTPQLPVHIPSDPAALRRPHPPPSPLPGTPSSNLSCHGQKHARPNFVRLNTPLFISTDVKDPLTDPSMAAFIRTFPCTFFLADFSPHIKGLDTWQSGYDGVMLKEFVLPFLDAMVVGKAWKVVGTEGSTFSRFVHDILWRTYHGWQIVQRG